MRNWKYWSFKCGRSTFQPPANLQKMIKIHSKIKPRNNSSFVILIFAISKFRNIDRSTFSRSKFRPPPLSTPRREGAVFTLVSNKQMLQLMASIALKELIRNVR